MRKGESEQVIEVFGKEPDANLVYVDAATFLDLLAGVSEPEKKRRIIGGEFIKVFDEEASKIEDIRFLAQGTIHPDILESDGVKEGKRYEGWTAIIRSLNTTDAMTATIEEIPYPLPHTICDRITHEVEGMNRVFMDITPKPIGTIEFE